MRASQLLQPSTSRSFESLYRRHLHDVYRYSLALLDRPADAEDATQATFLNAYRAIERGERPRNSKSWLRAIALNVCREQWRRARRQPDEVSLEADPGEPVTDEPTPGIGEVIRALSKLSFNQRAALVMREFEGRSLNEIAAALGVTGAAVESLLFRGRRALREQLDGSIRCHHAEELISRQLDGRIGYTERGRLRAHLRDCAECAQLARRLRARRNAIRSLALVPVPVGLSASKLGLPGSGHGVVGSANGAAGAPNGAAGSAHRVAAASGTGGGQASGGSFLGLAGTSGAIKLAGAAIVAAAVVGVGYVAVADHGSHAQAAGARASSGITSASPNARGASGLSGVGSMIAGARLAGGVARGGHAGGVRRGSGSRSRGRQGFAPTASSVGAPRYLRGTSHATGSTTASGVAIGHGFSHGVTRGRQHHVPSGNRRSPPHRAHPVHPVTPKTHVPPFAGGGGRRGHSR